MPELINEQAKDFLIRLGGGVVSALEDFGLEYYWKANPAMAGQFPYIRLHPNLPPCDDLIVGGLAIAPWVVGLILETQYDSNTKKLGESLREFGEGSIIYAAPMVMKRSLDTIPAPTTAARRTESPPAQKKQSPTNRQPTGIVYKL